MSEETKPTPRELQLVSVVAQGYAVQKAGIKMLKTHNGNYMVAGILCEGTTYVEPLDAVRQFNELVTQNEKDKAPIRQPPMPTARDRLLEAMKSFVVFNDNKEVTKMTVTPSMEQQFRDLEPNLFVNGERPECIMGIKVLTWDAELFTLE